MHSRRERHPEAVDRASKVVEDGAQIHMTAVTRYELCDGVEQFIRPSEERKKVLDLIGRYSTYPLDPPSADRAGEIHGSLRRSSFTIDPEDAMIAGIAMARGESVLTRNKRHFERIRGLVVESY